MSLPEGVEATVDGAAEPTVGQLRALWLPFLLFAAISIADTISSVIMLGNGMMEELNPVMRWVWEAGGVAPFVGVKAALVVGPLWLFNTLKVRRYWFIRTTVWVTILGYVAIYGVLFYLGNC